MRAAAARLAVAMQELSGEEIAVLVAVGVVLGTLPVYGCPTGLCLLAAVVFRLNAPALLLMNQLTLPLQLALAVPFVKLGERILGPHTADSATIVSRFGELTLHAIAGWFCISIPLGLILYISLARALRAYRPRCVNALGTA